MSKAERHAVIKREIVDAAWRLARERGLGGWSLRDVAEAVGMRAPSLYVYVESKNAVYDAMFAEGYAELLSRIPAAEGEPPAQRLRRGAHLFFDFCVEDPARHQLLFLRTLPGFEPSPSSYALAQQALDGLAEVVTAVGGSAEALDVWTALLTGLATQQVSNDPGGDRWARLVDSSIDLFLASPLVSASPRDRRVVARRSALAAGAGG